MITTLILTSVFIVLTVWLTTVYSGSCMKRIPSEGKHKHIYSILSVLLLAVVHIIEMLYFAGAYYFSVEVLALGGFTEEFKSIFRDYFNFSAVNYSTLDMSQFNMTGDLKILAAIESLMGFMMLSWTATFLYSAFGSQWQGDQVQ